MPATDLTGEVDVANILNLEFGGEDYEVKLLPIWDPINSRGYLTVAR